MDCFVCVKVVGGGAAFHGLSKDHVAVIIVDDEDVSIAVAGW